MMKKLWNDEAGLVTLEYILAATIVGFGLIVGFVALRNSMNAELAELGRAINSINQSYSWNAETYCGSSNTASTATDSNPAAITFGVGTPNTTVDVNVLACP